MSKKTISILSYFSLLLWLVAYFAGSEHRDEAKFYLNQSLVMGICSLIVGILGKLVTGWLATVIGIVSIVITVFWVIGLVHAIKQDDKEIPLIGKIQILK